ncbi:hypothetical protein [Streptomyces fulvorobeus]|uniref:Uncharacterized protein n=1 Tax=Streptomyces fulvorobeus TaxID=284028 RepID=A0A7J0CFW1_9ACTN|nr:hypothetical protein [Streptomyces fulvorobeus]NYE44109.1 hypothetical protein [Streptomyces fulvorobeus]GFN00617.1 hypothetical protein Sfulv_54270 [Streptomyces fulvorobeus]
MDVSRFLRTPGPGPVLRLVVLERGGALVPVLRPVLLPEAAVLSAVPGERLPPPSGTAGGLPWALLALAAGDPEDETLPAAVVDAVRAARAAGTPPARVLFGSGRAHLAGDAGVPGGDPLPCPVTLLSAEPDPRAVEAWQRLSPDGFTVRLLGPDAWAPDRGLPVTARLIKEELRVWPA